MEVCKLIEDIIVYNKTYIQKNEKLKKITENNTWNITITSYEFLMKINIGKTDIHFVGIGGIGMRMKIMLSLGFRIQGSDISDNKYLNNLRKRKIPIF